MRDFKWVSLLLWCGAALVGAGQMVSAAPKPKVLVYTRNFTPDGKGYVHDNIATSVEAIKKMGAEKGFEVDASDDPNVFTDANLKQYKALVFSNSNNEAFTSDSQRAAFKHFIQSGGGFVGIHSASGSERKWSYFWSVVGGKFVGHPKLQTFRIEVKDRKFPATRGLPESFEWTDECYFNEHLNPDIHVLLMTDRMKLQYLDKVKFDPNAFPNPLPLAWYHRFDGGREFYVALGHRKEEYSDPTLCQLIENGIVWAIGQTTEPGY
jgi:type 1 glutamine amidotransferase